ncbi:MAG: TonB-dependent receptor [Saprospirales bacterium]|nr:TonB-dependent receptor [Saprospirales bacterium]
MNQSLLRFFSVVSLILFALQMRAQVPTQVVRGLVADAVNGQPLPGATVRLMGIADTLGTATENDGSFRLAAVPVGRYLLEVSFVGYETLRQAETTVEAGKELVLNLALRESPAALQEVLVKASVPDFPGTLDGRLITVEEQFRFPATYYDPARLAMNFPAVVGLHDGTNLLSVRGNSPTTLRWRLEGLDIVNPNHTANAGTFSDRPTAAGGGVNILSAQLLDNSRFLPGNFPAGVGDALGGLLDMHLRRGNNENTEWTVQAGFIGLEAAAEGPFGKRKGRDAASWQANYRYSFTGLLTAMGADFGDEETAFQDLSFHFSFPSAKWGTFTLFGVGGLSETRFRSPLDSAEITEDKQRFNIDFESEMGVLGGTHNLSLGRRSKLKTALAWSALEHRRWEDLIVAPVSEQYLEKDVRQESKLSFRTELSHKLAIRHTLVAGFAAVSNVSELRSELLKGPDYSFASGNVDAWLLQPYAEWHGTLSKNVQLVAGLHALYFTEGNGEASLEPRLQAIYHLGAADRIRLAYGLHSQQQVLPVYLADSQSDAPLLKAHHFSLAWQRQWSDAFSMQLELARQDLFDVPVALSVNNPFSVLNITDEWEVDNQKLTFEGSGRNYSLELTLQRYMNEDFYFLLAGSLMRSRYKAADGVERPTRFDSRHTLNFTAGKEFKKQKGDKLRTRGVNLRAVWLGGLPETPVDVPASQLAGTTVYDHSRTNTLRQADYYRLDLRLYVSKSREGRRSLWSLDIQNLTSRKNEQYHYYDVVQGKVAAKKQLGLIPILSWRMEW